MWYKNNFIFFKIVIYIVIIIENVIQTMKDSLQFVSDLLMRLCA